MYITKTYRILQSGYRILVVQKFSARRVSRYAWTDVTRSRPINDSYPV